MYINVHQCTSYTIVVHHLLFPLPCAIWIYLDLSGSIWISCVQASAANSEADVLTEIREAHEAGRPEWSRGEVGWSQEWDDVNQGTMDFFS